jgi:phage/plasmid primase-like uncharacterized protein
MTINFNNWGHPAPNAEIDYPTLARLAIPHARAILEAWMPGGKFVGREYLCATIKGGAGTSCSTNINTGVGGDFATDVAWGDLIALISKADTIPPHEAAAKIAKFIGADLTKPLPALPSVATVSPEEKYQAGREAARRMLDEGVPCPADFPYLVRKGVKPANGVKFHQATGNMLVPLYDEHGALWSVQRISADGTKKINDGGRLSGNFFTFQWPTTNEEITVVYLAEGYATAATVHELTGRPAVMGISSGNMPAVAEALSRLYPAATLICAGDADDAGRKAVAKVQEKAPRFKAVFPPKEGDDWNDFGTKNADMARKMLAGVSTTGRGPLLVDVNTLGLTEPTFLVEDAIETPGTGMVFGASGSGKSFFILDIALHCAAGVPWLGKTVKEGPVIYLCGEGRHAVPRRVAAWRSVHGAIPDGRFLMSQRRVQFDPDTVCEMAGEIDALADKGGAPVLIVIDTMARALPGDCDENSAKDTMAFVDMCDRLQNQYNCAVIIIHHTGHAEDTKKRARGSSALKGAMDLEILLDAGRGVIEWMKTKDSEPHLPIKYELVKTTYGDGPRDNSCIVKYDVKYDPTTENMTKPAKVGAATLSTLCHKLGTTQIPIDTWREEFQAEYGGNAAAKRQAFGRAKNDLEKIKYIQIRGDAIHVKSVEVQGDSIEMAMFGHLLNGNGKEQ